MKSSITLAIYSATSRAQPDNQYHSAGNLLIMVNDSESSMNAVTYVAETMSGLPELHIHLAQMLPPYPPILTELWEREADQEKWKNAAKEAARHSSLKRAIDELQGAGIPPEWIETDFFQAERNGVGAVEALTDLAHQHRCDAIVVGQAAHSWFHNPFSYDLVDKLTHSSNSEGVNIWVVLNQTHKAHRSFIAQPTLSSVRQ